MLLLATTMSMRLSAFKQDASEEVTMVARADWHWEERLDNRARGADNHGRKERGCRRAQSGMFVSDKSLTDGSGGGTYD